MGVSTVVVVPPPPPALQDLPAGTRLVAGLGHATVLPDLDFETFSCAGLVWDGAKWRKPEGASDQAKPLSIVGVENYVRHPTFALLCLAYDLKDGRGRRRWRPGLPPPEDLFAYLRTGGLIEAHNVGFERWVWELHCVERLGWQAVRPEQWRCSMAKARAFALPGALADLGAVLGLSQRKDADGKRLLDKFSKPRNPTKGDPRTRILPLPTPADAFAYAASITPPGARQSTIDRIVRETLEEHVDAVKLYAYNEQDIVVEAEASSRIPDLEGEELAWWQVDQAINRRGVHIDRQGVEDCIAVIKQAHERYNTELLALTGIDAASKTQQLQGWLHARGVHLDSLDEGHVAEALKGPVAGAERRVLEIRAAVGSASVKKAFAIRNRLSADNRLRDLFIFHGARTGRATGEGPQPTNLPKAGPPVVRCGKFLGGKIIEGTGCNRHYTPARLSCPWCGGKDRAEFEWNPDAAEDALEVLRVRSYSWAEYVMGDAMATVAGALRGLFTAAPGHDLISSDYNSIEAVGLAMLAGEQWRVKVFRSHGKIYEASASTMYGVPFDEFMRVRKDTGQHHPLRQKGKIGELAFGYQGWVAAAQAFDMPGTENEIKADILRWRRASPAVEFLWGGQTVGKLAGVLQNALRDDYDGSVNPDLVRHRGASRWDDTPLYFGIEGAAVQAILTPGVEYVVRRLNGTESGISFVRSGAVLYCRLPSGRTLTYHGARIAPSERGGYAITYEGWNSNPKNGPMGWIDIRTWGGRLTENVNQAVCRDILRYACINLEVASYYTVLHVYDEIVAEVPEGFGDIKEFEGIMARLPQWAHDWPIRAPDGWRAKRYRKG